MDDHIKLLDEKLKALEDKQGIDVVTTSLTSVRNTLPVQDSVNDPWEASAHVETLVRGARSSNHQNFHLHGELCYWLS